MSFGLPTEEETLKATTQAVLGNMFSSSDSRLRLKGP